MALLLIHEKAHQYWLIGLVSMCGACEVQGRGGWQEMLRALCALEAVVQQGVSASCGECAIHFQSDPSCIQAACKSPQVTLCSWPFPHASNIQTHLYVHFVAIKTMAQTGPHVSPEALTTVFACCNDGLQHRFAELLCRQCMASLCVPIANRQWHICPPKLRYSVTAL